MMDKPIPNAKSMELDAATKQKEDWCINYALDLLRRRLRLPGELLGHPDSVKQYLTLKLAELEYESLGILFLDIRNKLIIDKTLFRGTLTHISIYPREIMREALAVNAGSIIIYHNHPSGEVTPSPEDINLTNKLKDALRHIDVKVVDHIIIAGMETYSFSEKGQL